MSLVFDLKTIRGKTAKKIPFQMTTDKLPENGAAWVVKPPLIFSGSMEPKARTIVMNGHIQVTMGNICGRCLKPIERAVDISFQEELLFQPEIEQIDTSDLHEDIEERYWIYDRLNYDFSDLVLDKVLTALPIAPLCDDNCPGLCSSCGQDLSEGDCGCQADEIDPRWAKLEKLKNKWEV